jgi:predicted ATPase/DNA-binding winged helix-turn-helix (wHTH) protein
MEPALPSTERPATPAAALRFGPGGRFELRPAECRLLADGQPAALGARALDLLMALAARPGELRTKGELLDIVWQGLVVEEGNLRVQVNSLRRLLGEDAIATVPGRGYRLSVVLQPVPIAAAAAPPPAPEPTAVSPTGATAPQRLFGRDADLDRLEALLRDPGRCVSLVGMPGVGKSSLARAALARWHGRSAWVDLAPLARGEQVPGAIARALGGTLDEAAIATGLLRLLPADAPMLLVIDNAEHLIESCAAWAAQLRTAPCLHLLVTSQLPLAAGGEQVLRLEPLPVHDPAAPSAANVAAADESALALLMARITEADRRFQCTPATLPLLRALCRQLDGLPLALEMAAARVPLMGLRAVHDAIAERFALLSRGRRDSPARHRTLHDALDWSYGLLGAPEQRLFRSLGVFAGGFTLDLAVTLTADEHVGRWDIVDGLATLVERSLVSVTPQVNAEDPPRYRLLETMRAYALKQLASPAAGAADDEGTSVRRRHAGAMLALFTRSDSDAQCLAEMDNAREAFLWARKQDLALAAQLSARVAHEVGFTIWRQEVTDWMLSLRSAMQQPAGLVLPLQTRAFWWSMLAYLLNVRRDPAARPAAKQAVSLWRQLDSLADLQAALGHWVRAITEPGPDLDEACAALLQSAPGDAASPRARLRVHGALAEAARVRGDVAALLACREQELTSARELGWNDMAQAAETNVCAALLELGRPAEAAERGAALLQRIDADGGETNGNLPWALNVLIEALTRLGRLAEARALVPRSLAAARRFGTTVAWQGILALVAEQRRFDAAGRLIGHVRRQWSASGATPDRDERARLERVEAVVQARLGSEATAALAAEGRSLDDAAAAALAGCAED